MAMVTAIKIIIIKELKITNRSPEEKILFLTLVNY